MAPGETGSSTGSAFIPLCAAKACWRWNQNGNDKSSSSFGRLVLLGVPTRTNVYIIIMKVFSLYMRIISQSPVSKMMAIKEISVKECHEISGTSAAIN